MINHFYDTNKVKIYNGDCLQYIKKLYKNNVKVSLVITSPPYNTSRKSKSKKALRNHWGRYDIYNEKTSEEYRSFIVKLFQYLNKILDKDGVICFNLSYSTENTTDMFYVISDIIDNTNFVLADCIAWKKSNALLNNASKNALTRIIEYIFVIVRKDEIKTFQCNKKVKSVSRTGQKYYSTIYNFIEAKNNDGSNPYNKATFSSDLVCALLKIYAKDKNIIFDPFLGTGTTAYAVLKYNQENKTKLKCLGAEISINQCKYATDRIDKDFSNVLKYR